MPNLPDPVVSPDVLRAGRIPPGQARTEKWPVLHHGEVPAFDAASWDFFARGLCASPFRLGFDAFQALPVTRVRADMHCVTRWSRLDNLWEGVSIREILSRARPKPEARFAMVHAENGFTANIPLAELDQADVLLAMKNNGETISAEHGYPLRLVVPRLYAWKSAKWVRGIEFLAEDAPGFWEQNGYHIHGDPWKEERFWGD